MQKTKPKIFISYARENMEMAKRLFTDLRRYDLNVWRDRESLLPGDIWRSNIKDAIENCNYFIAILSKKSISKNGYAKEELKKAVEAMELIPNKKCIIIPVRIDDCVINERILEACNWVDLFPENEYQNGLKRILKVVSPESFSLRTIHKGLSAADVNETIITHRFYDKYRNPGGAGYEHKYRLMMTINENNYYEKIVCDDISCLTWQQSGSKNYINYSNIKYWIEELNHKSFASIKDWRLPTVEEAMSLMEAKKNEKGVYIDPIFNDNQKWVWTSDRFIKTTNDDVNNEYQLWFVNYYTGMCETSEYENSYIRAVSSSKSPEEYFEKIKHLSNIIETQFDKFAKKYSVFKDVLK